MAGTDELFPARLAVRVTPPADYESPYSVELRLLNTSNLVDRFTVTVRSAQGSTTLMPSATVALYPGGDDTLVFPVFLEDHSATDIVIDTRSELTQSIKRQEVTIPENARPVKRPEVTIPAAGTGWPAMQPAVLPPVPRFGLLSDHPVGPGEDMFSYAAVASRMADFLLEAREVSPFTIGVQGGWGTGKSSLMQLLRQELDERTKGRGRWVRVAWFNAWTAEGSNALTALIRSVLQELEPRVMRRLLRRTRRSSWLTTPFVVLASWFGLRTLADDLWHQFRVDATQRNKIRKEIQGALSAWADKTQPLDMRRQLVVFIDDLDRCSAENIMQVFEAIRLYLDAPGLVFVIGYDNAVVSDALSRTKGASANMGRAYLEKIIQVDYALPTPDVRQSRALAHGCAKSCGVEHLLGEEELALIIERSGRNPRRLKRFLNTFVLSHQLDPGSALLRPDEHIKMLLLRMYFPELFQLILADPDHDVLGQLIELARLRTAVRADTPFDEKQVSWLCESLGVAALKPTDEIAEVLARLEDEASEILVTHSRNNGLFSLAWSLGNAEERADLLHRTRERLPLLLPKQDNMKCPQCGAKTDADDHFCPDCGAFLEWGSAASSA